MDTVAEEKKLRTDARIAVIQCGYPSVRAYIMAKLREVIAQAQRKNSRSTRSKKSSKSPKKTSVELP